MVWTIYSTRCCNVLLLVYIYWVAILLCSVIYPAVLLAILLISNRNILQSTHDHLFSTCTFNAVLVPRTNLSFPGLHLRDGGEIARAVCIRTTMQEDPQREAKPAVAINSQEVPSICDSADQYSPT